jgi:hypothetical protein
MIRNPVTLTGAITLSLNGQVVHHQPNLIVTAGQHWMAQRMIGEGNPMSYIAMGTGTETPRGTDTALASELFRKEVKGGNGVASNNQVTYTVELAEGEATGGITEAGLFDSSKGGIMLARTTFEVINKGDTHTLKMDWVITIT